MGREPNASDEPKWLVVSNLPAEALTRGIAWLLDLGVPVADVATATFQGPGPGSSKELRWCAAECGTVVQAAAASRRLSLRVLDGHALKAWPITQTTVEKLKDGRMRIEESRQSDEKKVSEADEASSQKPSSGKTGDKAGVKRGHGSQRSKSDKKSGKASRADGRRRDASKSRRRKRDASSSRTSRSVSGAAASPSPSAAAPKRRSLRDRAAAVLTRYRQEQDAVDGPLGASADGNAEAAVEKPDPQACMPVPATARLMELEGALAKITPGLVMMMNNRKTAAQAEAVAGETSEHWAKRKAAEAAREAEAEKKQRTAQESAPAPEPRKSRAVAPVETTEQRAKRKAAEAVLVRQRDRERAKRKAAEEAKRKAATSSLPSLYDFLPEPDPENDAEAARIAEAAAKASEKPEFEYTKDRSKVIFLDIDGVVRPLHGNQFQISSIQMDGENVPIIAEGGTEFMTTAMNALRHIMQETGAVIVLSSEWRRFPALRAGVNSSLRDHGLPAVSDDTPLHPQISFSTGNFMRNFANRRAREIGEWLRGSLDVKQWVVLDDIDLGQADEDRQVGQPFITPRFVLTDKAACLTMRDAKLAVRILHGQLNKPVKLVEGKDL